MFKIRLESLKGEFSIYRMPVDTDHNFQELFKSEFVSITKTKDEISIVCNSKVSIPGAEIDPGWRTLRISGQLDTSLVGILYRLTAPLNRKGVSAFVISTFDTDYLMVKKEKYLIAVDALNQEEGITVFG